MHICDNDDAGAEIVEVDMPGLAELNGKVSFPVALYEGNADLAKYLGKYSIPLDVKGSQRESETRMSKACSPG